jgi:hypothetical protein
MAFLAAGAAAGLTWALIGAGVAAVGIGLSTWQAVDARKRAADEADAIAEQKDKEAIAAQQSAAYAEQQHRRRMSLLLGKQQAVTAAAGVGLTGASAMAAELDLTTQSELEALQLRRGGEIESQAKTFEARLARYRADTQRGQIKYDIASGVLSAAQSGVGAYSSRYGYNYRSSSKNQAYTSLGSDISGV